MILALLQWVAYTALTIILIAAAACFLFMVDRWRH